MVKVSLIQDNIVSHLGGFMGLETSVKVDELRKRCATFRSGANCRANYSQSLIALHQATNSIASQTFKCGTQSSNRHLLVPNTRASHHIASLWPENYELSKPTDVPSSTRRLSSAFAIIDREHKSGIKQMKKLSEMYNRDKDQLPRIMTECTRNKTDQSDLCNFFPHSMDFRTLEEEIRKRIQGPEEAFKTYDLAEQNVMSRTSLYLPPQWGEYPGKQAASTTPNEHTRNNFKRTEEEAQYIRKANQYLGKRERTSAEDPLIKAPPPKHNRANNQTSLQCEEMLLTTTILIDGTLVTAIVDTGATFNVVKEQFVERLKKNPHYSRHKTDLILPNGARVNITKSTVFNITLGDSTADCTFLILPEFNEDIIVGLDFLREFSATITCAGISLTFTKISNVTERNEKKHRTTTKRKNKSGQKHPDEPREPRKVRGPQGREDANTQIVSWPLRSEIHTNLPMTLLPTLSSTSNQMIPHREKQLPAITWITSSLVPINEPPLTSTTSENKVKNNSEKTTTKRLHNASFGWGPELLEIPQGVEKVIAEMIRYRPSKRKQIRSVVDR